MVVQVRNAVGACNTAHDGAALLKIIQPAIAAGRPVVVDFSGVTNVTSSFVNVTFVAIRDKYGYSELKRLVKVVNANRQIANMLKYRVRPDNEAYAA